MIYLSFNIPQQYFPIRIDEMEQWKKVSEKFKIPIVPVSPEALFFQKSYPTAVYNMMGPVNTSHFRFLKKLESKGVRYINDIENSSRADDKFISSIICEEHNIKVPKFIDLNTYGGLVNNLKGEITNRIETELGFPCVIKYPNAGYGQGHFLVKSKVEFSDLYSILSLTNSKFGVHESGSDFFAQEFISDDGQYCPSIRVLMWKGEPVHAFIRRSKIHWKANLELLESQTTANHFPDIQRPIDDELRVMCQKICGIFKLKFAGIDIFETKNGYVLGEINSCPAIFSTSFNVFGSSGFDPFEEIVKELTEIR